MRQFETLDLYSIDGLLTDEERMVREAVHDWVQRRVMPSVEQWAYEGVFPRELVPEIGELNLIGASYSDYDLPGLVERGVRPDLPGARAWRLGAAVLRVSPDVAGHVPDPDVGQPGAEGPVDPSARAW